jgi:hypothetical protein
MLLGHITDLKRVIELWSHAGRFYLVQLDVLAAKIYSEGRAIRQGLT